MRKLCVSTHSHTHTTKCVTRIYFFAQDPLHFSGARAGPSCREDDIKCNNHWRLDLPAGQSHTSTSRATSLCSIVYLHHTMCNISLCHTFSPELSLGGLMDVGNGGSSKRVLCTRRSHPQRLPPLPLLHARQMLPCLCPPELSESHQ